MLAEKPYLIIYCKTGHSKGLCCGEEQYEVLNQIAVYKYHTRGSAAVLSMRDMRSLKGVSGLVWHGKWLCVLSSCYSPFPMAICQAGVAVRATGS